LEGPVKQKITINQLVDFSHRTTGKKPPNPNIYASLLTGKNLDYNGGKVWENCIKTCTTYPQFGHRYHQQMQLLIAKDGKEFTLFHNAYHHEYYKPTQLEHKGGDNDPVEPMLLPLTSIHGLHLMSKGQ
jgi:hypothetical protein